MSLALEIALPMVRVPVPVNTLAVLVVVLPPRVRTWFNVPFELFKSSRATTPRPVALSVTALKGLMALFVPYTMEPA